MNFSVRLSKRAARELKKLPRDLRARILKKIAELKGFPDVRLDIVPIAGEPDTYRLRIGDYRVLFVVFWEDRIIVVVRVGNRRSVYR